MLICCSQAKIILNEFKTELFGCLVGLKQGSCESPGLFAIYINSLDEEIKKSNIGVTPAAPTDASTVMLALIFN